MSTDAAMSTNMGEQAMDVNVLEDRPVLEEETTKEESNDPSDSAARPEWRHKSRNTLHKGGYILEGKREKKEIKKLEIQICKPTKPLKIEDGRGDKLGEIERTNDHIGRLKSQQLTPLHKILYGRPGASRKMRHNLRLFSGFAFERDSEPFNKKKEKIGRFQNATLRNLCLILDLEKSGKQDVLINRILNFLMCPTITGRKPRRKRKVKRYSNKDASAERPDRLYKKAAKSKKTKTRQRSSPKKPETQCKSKERVSSTESSSDEEVDRSEKKKETAKSSSVPESRKKKGGESNSSSSDDDDDVEEEEDDDVEDEEDSDEEEETLKTKSKQKPTTKKAPASKKNTPPKKTANKVEEVEILSDLSSSDDDYDDYDGDSDLQEKKPTDKKSAAAKISDLSDLTSSDDDDGDFTDKTKKNPAPKKQPPTKPVPKTKKADSSSNRAKNTASKRKDLDDSSDEDEPLIKIIKKPPTDEQLQDTVKDLLKDADLEEVTMKQICQKVYDTYPEFDLASRKDCIKQTVKKLIS